MPSDEEIVRAIRLYDPHEDIYKAQAAIRAFCDLNGLTLGAAAPAGGETITFLREVALGAYTLEELQARARALLSAGARHA
jgi:hypothetical protein